MVNTVPVSSSILAFVTTVHAALLLVHLHHVRGWARAGIVVPCLAFAVQPWLLTEPVWLVTGVAANTIWAILHTFAAANSGARAAAAHESAPVPGAGSRHPEPRPTAAPPTPRQQQPAFVASRILAVIDETPTIRTFRLARPAGFQFEAGQFLMVRVEVDGQPVVRCYSVSSPPATAGYLEISVRRQGLVSGYLHEQAGPGDTLAIHPPMGRFTMPSGRDLDLVLLAGGIGITPLISMFRQAVAADPERRVTLLYSVRAVNDIAFRDELQLLSARHPQARVVIVVAGGDAAGYRAGQINEGLVREVVPDLARSAFLICGPPPMIDAMRQMLLERMGIAAERVHVEAFQAATALAAQAARSDEAAGTPGRVTFERSRVEVDVRPGETLLEAGERAGARVTSFCRAGICGTCRTRVASGDVQCEGEALSDEERQQGWVLPCVAHAVGDCVLEA